jgi:hypothetical protein
MAAAQIIKLKNKTRHVLVYMAGSLSNCCYARDLGRCIATTTQGHATCDQQKQTAEQCE